MSEELKPCPFCGGAARVGWQEAYSCDSIFPTIQCSECPAMMEIDGGRGKTKPTDEEVAVWNRRASLAPAVGSPMEAEPVVLTYTNWRGETSERTIVPQSVWFGVTDWHPEPQWLLKAIDIEKDAERDFALKDFGPAAPAAPDVDLVEALRKARAVLDRCEHDGGFDREIGPIGCMLGDKCVCIGVYPILSSALAKVDGREGAK